MDMMGRKRERSGVMQWRIASLNGLLNGYTHQQWDEMEELIEHLPEEDKNRASAALQEGKPMTSKYLKSVLDTVDTASRPLCMATTLCGYAWLRIRTEGPVSYNQHSLHSWQSDCRSSRRSVSAREKKTMKPPKHLYPAL